MSKFAEVVKQDTPRLVVKYRSRDGRDEYEWGIVGSIPIIDLIGALAHANTIGRMYRDLAQSRSRQ